MAYGADTKALYRGAGFYVDKILKGANPAELDLAGDQDRLRLEPQDRQGAWHHIPAVDFARARRSIE